MFCESVKITIWPHGKVNICVSWIYIYIYILTFVSINNRTTDSVLLLQWSCVCVCVVMTTGKQSSVLKVCYEFFVT
jgi:hypothetical protein